MKYIIDTILAIGLMILGLHNIGSENTIVFILSGISFVIGLYLFFYEIEWE
jgi:hypothetical protein